MVIVHVEVITVVIFRNTGFPVMGRVNKQLPIKNVRGRLQAMCGGSLTLTSGSGSGTTVALKIPKGDEAAK